MNSIKWDTTYSCQGGLQRAPFDFLLRNFDKQGQQPVILLPLLSCPCLALLFPLTYTHKHAARHSIYLTPSNAFSTDTVYILSTTRKPVHTLLYVALTATVCVIFSKTWIRVYAYAY